MAVIVITEVWERRSQMKNFLKSLVFSSTGKSLLPLTEDGIADAALSESIVARDAALEAYGAFRVYTTYDETDVTYSEAAMNALAAAEAASVVAIEGLTIFVNRINPMIDGFNSCAADFVKMQRNSPNDNQLAYCAAKVTTWATQLNELRHLQQKLEKWKVQRSDAIEVIPVAPWLQIPDKSWDRLALELWIKGYSPEEIHRRVNVTQERVRNRITELRNEHGERIVPYRRKMPKS